MRIVVFGASGRTGRHLVEQATRAGHSVTAVVRAAVEIECASVVRADVFDPAQLAPVVRRHDAVVSVLGVREPRVPTRLCTDATTAIAEAMRVSGVRRLVVVSSAAVTTDGDDPFTARVVKPVLRRVLRDQLVDLRGMERVLAGTMLDWTVLRPPMLTDGTFTGRERLRPDRNVHRGIRLARRDLADAVLRMLESGEMVRRVVGVAT